MGRAARTCDQDLLSIACCGTCVGQGVVRAAVSRKDRNLDFHPELAKHLDCTVHDLGVRRASHHDPYCHISSSQRRPLDNSPVALHWNNLTWTNLAWPNPGFASLMPA